MNLGIFLALGDSFHDMAKSGQDTRFKKLYLKQYAKSFSKVYIFSYADEEITGLPKNIIIIPNKYKLHRYLYGLLLPFINRKYVKECDVFRVFHLSGTVPAIIAKLFLSKKFVFNFAYDYQKVAIIQGKKLQWIFFKVTEPISIFMADTIFAANSNIFKYLPKQKAVYLPNGVDISKFKPSISKNKKRLAKLIYIGRLEKEKNVASLIYAIAKIKKVKLTIIGQGSQELFLKNLAKKLKVNFIEKIENDKLPSYLETFGIFILPSFYEGHPKVLLDAQAMGLVCIAADNDGSRDIIKNGENGIICGTSSESIYKSIKNILENKVIADKISKKARENVVKNYNLDNLLQTEIATLRNLPNQ